MMLTPDILLRCYAAGIFPMAESDDDPELFWVDPELRGIIPLDDFHIPRRLRRTLRQKPFEISCDTAFAEVMAGCARKNESRPNTWINGEIRQIYTALYEIGHAHSVECWQEGRLVGGLYGVTLGSAFFGESMFSAHRDASKIALVHLMARLSVGGFSLLDTQFVTSHLARFGAREIPRTTYRRMLAEALATPAVFPAQLSEAALDLFLQSVTQIS